MSAALRILLPVALAALLVPWLRLLWTVWDSGAKDAAPSALAFGAAIWLAWRVRGSWATRPFLAIDAKSRVGSRLGNGAWVCGLATAVAAYHFAVTFDVRLGVGWAAAAVLACYVGVVHGGWPSVRALALPLLLFVLATPLPGSVLTAMTQVLLDLSIVLVVPALELVVGSVTTHGYVLEFAGGGTVHVVEDCSGLGGVLLFVPIAIVLADGRGLGPGGMLALAAVALPLSFIGSLVRVFVSAVLVDLESSWAYSDAVHEALGIGSLVGALALLVVVSQRLPTRTDTSDPEPTTPSSASVPAPGGTA